jgi:hypothetical protein
VTEKKVMHLEKKGKMEIKTQIYCVGLKTIPVAVSIILRLSGEGGV